MLRRIRKIALQIYENKIVSQKEIKFLGIKFDSELTFSAMVDEIKQRCSSPLNKKLPNGVSTITTNMKPKLIQFSLKNINVDHGVVLKRMKIFCNPLLIFKLFYEL
ncbi:hypothetical protein BpHYR1_033712 [Brachionus plicatilis]|uniref:RNA-directed DNA polymerase from mobile element jockey-like n=1 Tax=Brachionus plicatilis TaxID=10195 RepID=A0A3M7RNN3_BRAPC|nr:hypothetical protein BpHYR1_033712 [Brachionus plicatilis]